MPRSYASMRPPVLPSGNAPRHCAVRPARPGFNEAAGFTQRKRRGGDGARSGRAAASMRPPVLPSGNYEVLLAESLADGASMRPPVLPSGNQKGTAHFVSSHTASMRPPVLPQRKLDLQHVRHLRPVPIASMRPPVLPSGNEGASASGCLASVPASMRPPVLPSGNAPASIASRRLTALLQ